MSAFLLHLVRLPGNPRRKNHKHVCYIDTKYFNRLLQLWLQKPVVFAGIPKYLIESTYIFFEKVLAISRKKYYTKGIRTLYTK